MMMMMMMMMTPIMTTTTIIIIKNNILTFKLINAIYDKWDASFSKTIWPVYC